MVDRRGKTDVNCHINELVSNNASHIDFDLLAKYLSNECSEAERSEVEHWKALHPDNQLEFDQFEQIWRVSESSELNIDVDQGWTNVSAKISGLQVDQPAHKTSQTSLRIAAGIALLVVSSLSIWFFNQTDFVHLQATNEPVKFEFEDGSVVNLAANSELIYPEHFDGSNRTLSMTGQAYFEISKDASRPFIIETILGKITVVGTAFEVNANAELQVLTVEVAEGIVEVENTNKKQKQRVTAGQQCTVSAARNEILVDSNLSADAFYWNDRTLKFKRTELASVVQTLHDLFQIDIRIEGEQIQGCKLTATFVDESAETMLEVIAATLKVELKKEGNSFVFSGTGC